MKKYLHLIKEKCRLRLCLVASCLLLSGCSMSFVYNHLDWWVNWYLDDYVDLTRVQQKEFDQAFENLHRWHRQHELPRYAALLKRLKVEVLDGSLTGEELETYLTEARGFWLTVVNKAEPDLSELVLQLNSQQKQAIISNLADENKELRDDHKELSPEKRIKKRAKNQEKQLKEWFGRLTKQQKDAIKEEVKDYQSTYGDWLNYRDNWLDKLTLVFNQQLVGEAFKEQFRRLLTDNQQFKSPEYQAAQLHNRKVFIELFLNFIETLTPKQKKRFNRRIDNLIEDLTELSEED